jgi:hypothetical protein
MLSVLGVEQQGRAQEKPRTVVMDRDSVFHTSNSRVLRASLPFPSCRVRSSAFLVLQPPTAAVHFPSQPLPKYRARQQKCTRPFHIYDLHFNLWHLNSSFPFPSPFGLAEAVMQALAPVTEFGRSSARMKRCVKFVHSHNFVNRIRKGYVCPSVANATARPGAKLYIDSTASRCFAQLRFTFRCRL